MAKHIEEKYSCDKCGKTLPTFANSIAIVTEQSGYDVDGSAGPWSRFRITVEYHHGMHNDGETEPADLCKKCAVALLTDALARVRKGERVSKGVEGSRMLKFDEAF